MEDIRTAFMKKMHNFAMLVASLFLRNFYDAEFITNICDSLVSQKSNDGIHSFLIILEECSDKLVNQLQMHSNEKWWIDVFDDVSSLENDSQLDRRIVKELLEFKVCSTVLFIFTSLF